MDLTFRQGTLAERIIFVSILLFGFFCPISIAAAQSFAAIAFIVWISGGLRRKVTLKETPKFLLPLVIFILLSLLSVIFSVNPIQSLWSARNLLLFLVIPLVLFNLESMAKARMLIAAVGSGALVTASWGMVQVVIGAGGGDSSRRLTGFLGHYMTAGGELMLVALILMSVFFFSNLRWEKHTSLASAALVAAAVGLTQSRNVYIGLAFGAVTILLLWRPLVVALLPFALSLAVLISPPVVRERIFSIADVHDNSIQNRITLVQTGLAMVADSPLFGVGLRQAEVLNPRYDSSGSKEKFPHLHNNILQIAAERGIPAALIWIWMMASIAFGHIRIARRSNAPPWLKVIAVGACASVVALFVAGLFEYNFGDSEVLMLFLLLVTLPYALWTADQAGEQ